ncbi:discoidin domain-containing protein [Paenibacillus polysaccharolyticus]|uniref:discoidin domain-containing protein n=1 Tax=Paenibacillus polysaccharolyticus TaxID=582692 RepID=UPI00203F7086|nr:discoidin domain-containing protein [Paenibacillus polysaccharolyticus]MCM3131539.1 discoidin domain-containing protein [Paenibacillus polysaccharolyticus]
MATVGEQIKEPEAGWRRYDDTHPGLKYTGTWTTPSPTNAGYYGGSIRVTSRAVDNNYVTFSFFGTKLRIISDFYSDRHSDNAITIDGVTETYSAFRTVGTSSLQQAIVYEKVGLTLGFHTVSIAAGHNRINFTLDAIDIDETGYLSGYALTSPEAGWRRIDNRDSKLTYTGSWGTWTSTSHYLGEITASNVVGSKLNFFFKGTKLRIIDERNPNRTKIAKLSIDGKQEFYNSNGTQLLQVVVYEKTGMSNDIHHVEIEVIDSNYVGVDAVDVDDDGYLIAQVGQKLTAPEVGWKRYDDATSEIKYEGTGWVSAKGDSNTYAGTAHYVTLNGVTSNNIKFDFYGTKMRIIDLYWTNRVNNVTIEIDGVISTWNPNNSSNKYQVMVFEVIGLSETLHNVKISTTSSSGTLSIDGVDVDSTGRLFHPDEVTNVANLEVGKRIRCHYQSSIANTIGTFSGLGEQTSAFIPDTSSATPNGDFYFIMVEDWNGRKLLVADRNIQNAISWDVINANGMVGGKSVSFAGLTEAATSIRLLTGGINASDKDNEWDKYIVHSNLNGKVATGDNNVWNYNGGTSWTSTTNATGTGNRTGRGANGNAGASGYNPSAYLAVATATGFRPVMEVTILPMYRSLIKYAGTYQKYEKGDFPETIYRNANPTMTSNTSPQGVVSTSSIYNSTYEGWKAMNGGVVGVDDCWATANNTPSGTLTYQFVSTARIGAYAITSRDATDTFSAPKNWTFEASNDGKNWVFLHTVNNEATWTQKQRRVYVLDGNYSYVYFRLNITANYSTSYTSVGEWELIEVITVEGKQAGWSPVSTSLPAENTLFKEGMADLSVFDRKLERCNQIMVSNGSLGSGKLFKSSLNLKKYFEITNVNAK